MSHNSANSIIKEIAMSLRITIRWLTSALLVIAIAPVEKAIKQAVSEFTQEKQKNYKEYSLIWHWCNYILYMVENVVTTFAGKMQKGMEESLKSA